ncbi:D-2-hydroxyacid dehydrogenase [Treponema sp.]|uniref:D-2-hydroxyacid dehydrogenase n=1 Tax=Treponema sp. TaxID=166 RepID=UPI0025F6D068|nr:D-2-hydroxyacid dehydrogenase [Treponema sp.]MCR5217765.1 D-2-hydroxyacid dehydrogenase [Treponema sp.]
MKITILDGHALNPGDLSYKSFERFGAVFVYPRTEEKDVITRIGDSDVVIMNKIKITEDILKACPSLKYIGIQATGYNVVDLDACRKHNVTVTNVPSYSTAAVAQHVFALITAFTNRVTEHSESVFKGQWTSSPDFCYWNAPLAELDGKKLGIAGYGNIGSRVAKIARAFGMDVVTVNKSQRAQDDNVRAVGLEGLKGCDFISLHCPLTKDNEEMFNKDLLSKIAGPETILINTARGGLVNEKDLADMLNNGQLKGYGADVVKEEPMRADNPLLKAKNCILTPHIAWAPLETRKRLLDIVINNLDSWIKGSPVNVVS